MEGGTRGERRNARLLRAGCICQIEVNDEYMRKERNINRVPQEWR
jgi:hypothetical protein